MVWCSFGGAFDFYPRSPCGERHDQKSTVHAPVCISIHALLAESDAIYPSSTPPKSISIHALLAESDRKRRSENRKHHIISIHALLAESDVVDTLKLARPMLFLSTLSLRRATPSVFLIIAAIRFLSTLSLRRATISCRQILVTLRYSFLSTLSLRRATQNHLLRTIPRIDFYPRSPCGERQRGEIDANSQQEFLSTLSLRRATMTDGSICLDSKISIHALLAESDRLWTILYSCPGNFYPRSPCGERRLPTALRTPHHIFLSTLSLRRATYINRRSDHIKRFLSTLSLRRATNR